MSTKWMTKLTDAAKADPRKAGALGVLVVVMGALWGKTMLSGSAPESAAAAVPAAVVGQMPGAHNQLPSGARAQSERLEKWTRTPVKPLGRNLFAVQLDYYRREGGNDESHRPSTGFWEDLEKSQARQTDQKKVRQVLLENLQQQATQIKLQSTMMGARPQAMVNGELVAEGGVVTVGPEESRVWFRVLKIEARSMIVEREGIKLEIQMK